MLSAWLIDLTGRGVSSRALGRLSEVTAYCPGPVQAESVLAETQRRWADFCSAQDSPLPLAVAREIIHEQDWANSWKAYYHPFRVGRRLVIKPSWEPWPPPRQPEAARPEDLVIELDPQMAFGTGTHETTQMCLEALERHLSPGDTVADVGCGSGILAIAAALLGSGTVRAWDLDPLAVEATRENCARNGVSGVCTAAEGDALEALAGEFDLIVANVHTPFLVSLIPRLPGRLRAGGRVILSGASESSVLALREALAAAGLELVEEIRRGEWLALVARSLTPYPLSLQERG